MTGLDLVSIVASRRERIHFVGLGGTGMSALAQFRALNGGATSGSDRAFDQPLPPPEMEGLRELGITLFPQDGTGVAQAAMVVASTAIEAAIPDLARARELDIPIVHRADLLAVHSRAASVAVAGTSGKSTVTAMVYEILRGAGRDPGLITGGRLTRLMEPDPDAETTTPRGLGNAAAGKGPIVFEADESDGSLIKHAPETGLLLNLHRDHMEPEEAMKQFRLFRAHTRGPFVVSDDAPLAELRPGALVYGFSAQATLRAAGLDLRPDSSTFRIGEQRMYVPVPGEHNARNALAAIATCRALGVDAKSAAEAIADYRGVYRRMNRIGDAGGIVVLDDFAHNPEKIRAAMTCAAAQGKRLLAFFQPHGFAPTRFLRDDLVATFDEMLRRKRDRLWLGDIYFAGGTATRDISSADLVDDLEARGAPVHHAADRDRFVHDIVAASRDGDVILIMGARDPSLPALARSIVTSLGER